MKVLHEITSARLKEGKKSRSEFSPPQWAIGVSRCPSYRESAAIAQTIQDGVRRNTECPLASSART